jgi:hypothetical protein
LIRRRNWASRFWIGLFGEAYKCWQTDLTPELSTQLKRRSHFLSILRSALQSFGVEDVCSFAVELADTNSRMQQAVAGMFQALADEFAEQVRPIAAQCSGKQAPSADELADALLGTVEGSIILAKAHRDPTRIPRAIRAFRLSLATLIGEPA